MKKRNRNVLAKTLLLTGVIMLFGAALWSGGEPWKGKPYQQWDDKDIQRIFTDSPWTRTTTSSTAFDAETAIPPMGMTSCCFPMATRC